MAGCAACAGVKELLALKPDYVAEAASVQTVRDHAEAVSYTHLDVYKRQPSGIPMTAQPFLVAMARIRAAGMTLGVPVDTPQVTFITERKIFISFQRLKPPWAAPSVPSPTVMPRSRSWGVSGAPFPQLLNGQWQTMLRLAASSASSPEERRML